jgi:hypothetical protein
MNITANQLKSLMAAATFLQNSSGPINRAQMAAMTNQGNTKQSQAWADFGWPDSLTFTDLYGLYRRNALAGAVVSKPVEFCWSQPPMVYEGKDTERSADKPATAFEIAFSDLSDRLSLFKKMRQADLKGRVGFYSAFLIRVAGSTEQERDWQQPLLRISADQILQLIPVYSEQLKVAEFDTNQQSMRFGQPLTYNYSATSGIQTTEQTQLATELTVHHSRVIVFTETPDSESIEGIPAMSKPYNYLLVDDLIVGAGGQGFWKNSGNKLTFSTKDINAQPPSADELEQMQQQLNEFDEGLFKQLIMGGFDVNQLQVALNDPKPFADIVVARVSACTGIPQNILNGTQTGVLAGDKDMMSFLQTMNSRCANWCAQMVEQFIDWCIEHGALPKVRYMVSFPDLAAANEETKLTLVNKMTTANKDHLAAQAAAGLTERRPLFTEDEIRAAGGRPPLKIQPVEIEDDITDPEMDEQQ